MANIQCEPLPPVWIEPLLKGILPDDEIACKSRYDRKSLVFQGINYIYGLFDRSCNQLIYVGRTCTPDARLVSHRNVLAKDLKEPAEMEILEICSKHDAADVEAWWINYMLFLGCPLRNKHIPVPYRKASMPVRTKRRANGVLVDGAMMKLIRQNRDMKLERVALAAALSARRIQQIEATVGGCHLNANVVNAIAKVLGVKVDDIKYQENTPAKEGV